jgi:hypothetical protein
VSWKKPGAKAGKGSVAAGEDGGESGYEEDTGGDL